MTESQDSRPTTRDGAASYGVTEKALRGMFWTGLQAGVRIVLHIAVVAATARLLTPDEFGLFFTAIVVIEFFLGLTGMGIRAALVQRPNLSDDHCNAGLTLSLLVGLVVGALVFAMVPFASKFFDQPQLTSVVRTLTAVFVLRAPLEVASALLQRAFRFRELAAIQLISFVIGPAGMTIVGAGLGWGVWSLVAGYLAGVVVDTAASAWLARLRSQPSLNPQRLRELVLFGGGLTINRIVNYFALQGDNLVVARFLGAAQVGVYNRAYTLMALPANLFQSAVERVFFSAMSRVQEDPVRQAWAFRRGLALVGLLSLPGSAMCLVLAPEIVAVLLGRGWDEVTRPLTILAAGMFFRVGYKVAYSAAISTGAVYRSLWRQAIYSLLVVGGCLVGQSFGLAGVATAVLIALTVEFALMTQLAANILALTLGQVVRLLIPSIVTAACTLILSLAFATIGRSLDLSHPVVLIGTAAVATSLTLLIVYLTRGLMIGGEGRWWVQTIMKRLPRLSEPQ